MDKLLEIPSRDKREKFMRAVYENANFSKDPKTKIGAVIVKDDGIVSEGFNGFPRKVKDYVGRYLDRNTKYLFVCHAEANSVFSAARNGISTLGSTIYTNGIPCSECMKAVIQGGIKKIVIHKQWPMLDHVPKWVESINISKQMIEETGIELEIFDKELNVEGFLDGKIIKV